MTTYTWCTCFPGQRGLRVLREWNRCCSVQETETHSLFGMILSMNNEGGFQIKHRQLTWGEGEACWFSRGLQSTQSWLTHSGNLSVPLAIFRWPDPDYPRYQVSWLFPKPSCTLSPTSLPKRLKLWSSINTGAYLNSGPTDSRISGSFPITSMVPLNQWQAPIKGQVGETKDISLGLRHSLI